MSIQNMNLFFSAALTLEVSLIHHKTVLCVSEFDFSGNCCNGDLVMFKNYF